MKNIGFGCVKLTSNLTRRQALKNLEIAYDHGVRHFDVARLYGFGLAEGILGQFAQDKRDDITITSKLGIFPNGAVLRNLFLQNVIRSSYRLLKKLPVYKPVQTLAGQSMKRNFAVPDMRLSLETSLKELRTDHIDYLMLHEAYVNEANNEDLINFLTEQKNAGVIKAFGLGSFANKLEKDFSLLSKNYTVLQTDNSFPAKVSDSFLKAKHINTRFYFSPLRHLNKVQQILKTDKPFADMVSGQIGFDAAEFTLDLFLMQQRFSDPSGTLLFTSSHNDKIKETIKRWARVQALPDTAYANFGWVREVIGQKLITQNI